MSEVKRYVPVVVMGGTLPTVAVCEDGWLIHSVDHERIVADLRAEVELLSDLAVDHERIVAGLRAEVEALRDLAGAMHSATHAAGMAADADPAELADVISRLQVENARFRSAAKHATPYAWLGAAGLYRSRVDGVANGEQLLTPLYKCPEPAAQVAVPDGYKLVPVEPTPEMVDASVESWHSHLGLLDDTNKLIYRAMLAAAPTPPEGQREIPVAVPDEREAFEAWQRKGGHKRPEDAGEWEAWQARAALSDAPTPPAQQSQLADTFMLVTPEQVDRHSTTAWECPPGSNVILVSSLKRLHNENTANLPSTPGDTAAPEQAEQQCQDCGGSGDVHRPDGEWMGECKRCKAEQDAVTVPIHERWAEVKSANALRAEVERLRKDAERLTWLIDEEARIHGYLAQHGLRFGLVWPNGDQQADLFACPREAIDAALEASR